MVARLALRERSDGVRGSLRDAAARAGLPVVDLTGLDEADVPPAAVLDLARLADGRFVVLETNNPWSSGVYGCDPDAVLTCVLRANEPAAPRWRWHPDPHLRYA